MVDEQAVPATSPVAGPTEQELLAQLQAAINTGNFKAVAKVSTQLVKFQNAHEAAELAAKQDELKATSNSIGAKIMKVLQPMYDKGELDKADGVWFTWDFEEKSAGVRLIKSQAKERKASGGGGTGKKYPATAPGSELWLKHKDDVYKDSGMTVEAAHNSNTDKNWRYAIHQFVLKAEGIVT